MRERIQAAIPYLEQQLAPSDPKTFAVAMDRLIDFAETFGLPVKDLKAATGFYLETLADLPEDLLMTAVQRTIAEHRYHVLPKPGEIKARVEDDMKKRRRHLGLAKRAVWEKSRAPKH